MLDPVKQAKLQAFLTALPDRHATRLLAACEAAEQQGGDAGLPLDLVRETLAARGRGFMENAFGAVLPIVTPEGGPKRPGRIARGTVQAVAAYAETIAPKAFEDLSAGNPPINAHREILGRALRGALRDDDADTRLRSKLGGERGLLDAREIAALLCAEPELSDGLAELPERIEDLNENYARRIRDLFEAVRVKDRNAPLLLLFVLLERLDKRAQILRVLKKIVGQEDDLVASQTDVAAIGDMLLDEAEAAVASLAAPVHGAPDGPEVADALARFASISRGMTRELGIRRDGKWGLRLKDLRNEAAKNMDVLCAAAPRAIDAALPQTRMSLAGGAPAMRPDFSAPPREEIYGRGLNFAIILGGAAEYASSCAFTAQYAKARESADRMVHAFCDGIIELLQRADDDMLPAIEPWREVAVHFAAALFDETDTDVFRRRAAAALVARSRDVA